MSEKDSELEFFEYGMFSTALWAAFEQVVLGADYVTKIAKKLKKNKSVISKQLRKLADLGVLVSEGEGPKQHYTVDWSMITFYWIYVLEPVPEIIADLFENAEFPKEVPEWMKRFYLEPEEANILLKEKRSWNIIDELKPIRIQLAEVVKLVTQTVIKTGEYVRTFNDLFLHLSFCFALGLPNLEKFGINREEIKFLDNKTKKLIEVFYSPKIRLWLKSVVLGRFWGALVVQNYIINKFVDEKAQKRKLGRISS